MSVLSTIKTRGSKLVVGGAALLGSAAAMATETSTSEGVAAISALETEATNMISAAWPVAIAIVGGGIAIKLFKKFANKAS